MTEGVGVLGTDALQKLTRVVAVRGMDFLVKTIVLPEDEIRTALAGNECPTLTIQKLEWWTKEFVETREL